MRGARLGVSGQITRRWQVFGGYTYLDARIMQAIAPGTLGMVPVNTPQNTATAWTTYEVAPHWQIGGAFIIVFLSAVVGLLVYAYCRATAPAFFKKQTLTRATPTLVPED